MMQTRLRLRDTVPALLCAAALALLTIPGRALAASAAYVPKDSSGGYDTLDEAILDGQTAITLRGTDSSIDAVPSGVTVTLSGGVISTSGELTVNGVITGSGAISAGSLYLTGGNNIASSGVNYSCTVYYRVQLAGLSGAVITKIVGSSGSDLSPTDLGGGYYKTTAGSAPTAAYDAAGNKYVPVNGTFTRQFSIAYLDQDGKAITPTASGSYVYPTSCTANDPAFTIGDPKIQGYAFQGWVTSTGLEKTVLVTPGALTGNIAFVASLTEEAAGGGAAGRTGGGVAGGGSGTYAAAAATTIAASDDADSETDAAASAAATTATSRGQRVRTASSTSRHTLASESEADIEALASARARRKTFPWQWVGVGAGGVAVCTAVLLTIRRRRKEKYAATLEKLRIFE